MQDLKVTLVQANQVWEDKQANFRNYETLLNEVDSNLIVLPEMFHTGFSMSVTELAEDMKTGQAMEWLKNMAATKDAAIYTSFICKDGQKVFNRGVFVTPSGEHTLYDKRKSFGLAGEDKVYTAGNEEVIVEYNSWKFQLQICYDLRFPELIRNKINSNHLPNYDVLVYVANWPEKRSQHWNTLLAARAIENQCYVIGVNRVGIDANGLSYSGDSKMVDPLGDEINLNSGQELATTVNLNMNSLTEIRKTLPFLKDQ